MIINWTQEAYPEEIAELLIEDSNGDDMEETVANNDMLSSDEESSAAMTAMAMMTKWYFNLTIRVIN